MARKKLSLRILLLIARSISGNGFAQTSDHF
ncbi:hypothetical protein CCACVL1_28039 [Corchorus capsularis]|uniref:Uncharacterized protein n=1 Tax=Corchorus capsularis TaxID=210143 RepID=A0A1R3G7P3_COCAP|nr:hypothetical protein CCACVL1_28039 [Corchorus capsularis]